MFILVQSLTASRIIGVIPFVMLLTNGYSVAAFFVFFFLALTDLGDGWLARKFRCVSDWGKFFDPTADKIFLLTALFMLLPRDAWIAFFVLAALEVVLFATAFFAYAAPNSLGAALGANPFGKIKAFVEISIGVVLFLALLFGIELNSEALSELLGVAIGFAALSLIGHWMPVLRLKTSQIPSIR